MTVSVNAHQDRAPPGSNDWGGGDIAVWLYNKKYIIYTGVGRFFTLGLTAGPDRRPGGGVQGEGSKGRGPTL